MKHIDLFAGIGGFSLAASWVWPDHEVVAFCEKDEFCQKVLKKHWPDVPIISDIRELTVDSIVSLLYNQSTPDKKKEIDMAARRKDYDEAVNLYNSGLSTQVVAEFYDITRQAMWMILKRRGCTFRPQKKTGEDNPFYRYGQTEKGKSYDIVRVAIKEGILEPKMFCEICGSTPVTKDGRTGVQAHHNDYNKPLCVKWLCVKCHHEWHKSNKPIERKEVKYDGVTEACSIDIVSGGFP
jgi:hypothetical protein